MSSEADAPSLFEGTSTAKPKTAQKTAKRGKLYGSDDAAWESEVRKDLAKKKTGTVDNAVSKRVAEVSQEVASYRATATAAVDAFVALSNAGAFSKGTRDALDALAALDAAVPDLNASTGFAAIGNSTVLGAALALAHAHSVDAVLTSNDSIQRRVIERGLVVLGDRDAPECLALACAALEAAPACFSGNLPNYEPPLRSAIVAAARALQRCVGAPHIVKADCVSAALALARAAALDDQLRLALDKADLSVDATAAALCSTKCDAATTSILCGAGPRAAGLLSAAPAERRAARGALSEALAHNSPLSDASEAAAAVSSYFEDDAAETPLPTKPAADALVALALDDADDDDAYANARAAARRACADVDGDVWSACRTAFDAAAAPPEEASSSNVFAAPGDDSLERSAEAKAQERSSKARRRRRAAQLLAALCAAGKAPGDAFPWVVSKLDDPDDDVRSSVVQLGVACVDADGDDGLAVKIKSCEDALAKATSCEAVTLLGAAASHLAPDDERVADVADRLVDVLVATTKADEPPPPPKEVKKKPRAVAAKTGIAAIGMAPQKKNPFAKRGGGPAKPRLGAADIGGLRKTRAEREGSVPEKKQRTFDIKPVADCLGKLAKTMKKTHAERAGSLVERLRETSFSDRDPATRRKASTGLAAVVKGLGIGALKKQEVVERIRDALDARAAGGDLNAAHGALSCIEALAKTLGVLFEPYEIKLLAPLLNCFADSSDVVRNAAKNAAREVFGGSRPTASS